MRTKRSQIKLTWFTWMNFLWMTSYESSTVKIKRKTYPVLSHEIKRKNAFLEKIAMMTFNLHTNVFFNHRNKTNQMFKNTHLIHASLYPSFASLFSKILQLMTFRPCSLGDVKRCDVDYGFEMYTKLPQLLYLRKQQRVNGLFSAFRVHSHWAKAKAKAKNFFAFWQSCCCYLTGNIFEVEISCGRRADDVRIIRTRFRVRFHWRMTYVIRT